MTLLLSLPSFRLREACQRILFHDFRRRELMGWPLMYGIDPRRTA